MIECILNKDSRAGSIKSYALQYHTMSLSRCKVSSMEKYDKEITKLSTSIILLQCRRTFRSIPIFLSWKGKLAASTKVKIIPTPLLHSFCSAPQEIESQLRAWAEVFQNFVCFLFPAMYLLHNVR